MSEIVRKIVLFSHLLVNDHSINAAALPARRTPTAGPARQPSKPPRASDMTQTLPASVQRKVIRRIIPILMLMYTMAYLDRINIGTAALRMNAELGISQQVFGLAAGLFFIGYLAMEIPSNI